MLNRGVLIIRPSQPFLDWAAKLDDSGVLPPVEGEQTVYLIPEFEDDQEAQSSLKAVYSEVLERELYGWHTDETQWPKHRTLAKFREWYVIELHSVVEDLCAYESIDDEA